MRKLTRDEERFKSCLKKSKSKTIHLTHNGNPKMPYWYFKDVEQTGWHPETITDLIKDKLINIRLMVGGGAGVAYYQGITWNSTKS